MDREDIIRVLQDIKSDGLSGKEKFARYRHFFSSEGKSLPPRYTAIARAVRNCVGGAAIRGLITLKLNTRASSSSEEYDAVMCALADTLEIKGGIWTKIRAVQKFNNSKGYQPTIELVDKTIERLSKTETRP